MPSWFLDVPDGMYSLYLFDTGFMQPIDLWLGIPPSSITTVLGNTTKPLNGPMDFCTNLLYMFLANSWVWVGTIDIWGGQSFKTSCATFTSAFELSSEAHPRPRKWVQWLICRSLWPMVDSFGRGSWKVRYISLFASVWWMRTWAVQHKCASIRVLWNIMSKLQD